MHGEILFVPLMVITIASTQGAPAPPESEFTHSDQIARYVAAVVGVTRAEKICPGYRRNSTNMAALRKWLAIQESDKAEIARVTIEATQNVSSKIEKLGVRAWCASILELVGPEGTVARGLLQAK